MVMFVSCLAVFFHSSSSKSLFHLSLGNNVFLTLPANPYFIPLQENHSSFFWPSFMLILFLKLFLPSLFLAIFFKFHFPTTFFSSSSSWLLYFIPLPCKYLSSLFLTTCCPSQYLPVSFIPIPGYLLSSLFLATFAPPSSWHLLPSRFLTHSFIPIPDTFCHPYSWHILSSLFLTHSFIPIPGHLSSKPSYGHHLSSLFLRFDQHILLFTSSLNNCSFEILDRILVLTATFYINLLFALSYCHLFSLLPRFFFTFSSLGLGSSCYPLFAWHSCIAHSPNLTPCTRNILWSVILTPSSLPNNLGLTILNCLYPLVCCK